MTVRGWASLRFAWLLLGILLTGCSDGGEGRSATLSCDIIRRPLVSLGDSAGPGIIADETSTQRGPAGRFFVYRPYGSEIKVFDAAGEYVATVGRHGQGPSEIGEIASLEIDPDGGLHVFDFSNLKILRFSPVLEFLDEVRLEVMPTRRTLLVDSTYYLVGEIYTQDRLGYPLHEIGWDGVIGSSFGTDDPQARPDVPYMGDRVAALSSDGNLWVAHRNKYVIEKWTPGGRRLQRFEPDRDWFQAGATERRGTNGGPRVVTTGVYEDSLGHLWLSAVVPDPEWKSAVRGDPGADHPEVTDVTKYYDVHVDVLDADDGRLLGSARTDSLYGFVGNATAASGPRIMDRSLKIPTWSLGLDCATDPSSTRFSE